MGWRGQPVSTGSSCKTPRRPCLRLEGHGPCTGSSTSGGHSQGQRIPWHTLCAGRGTQTPREPAKGTHWLTACVCCIGWSCSCSSCRRGTGGCHCPWPTIHHHERVKASTGGDSRSCTERGGGSQTRTNTKTNTTGAPASTLRGRCRPGTGHQARKHVLAVPRAHEAVCRRQASEAGSMCKVATGEGFGGSTSRCQRQGAQDTGGVRGGHRGSLG